MRYPIIKLLLPIIIFLLPIIAYAQYPIQIQALSPIPTPSTIPQLLGQTSQPLVILVNTSNKEQSIKLSADLTSNNGIAGNLDSKKRKPRLPIIIPAFQTITLTGDDLLAIFANYSILDVNYKGISPVQLAKNPLFPEGTYKVCITAYDYENSMQLSPLSPSGCSGPIVINHPQPPIITYPQDEQNIVLAPFDNMHFNWTPVTINNGLIRYKIRIAEVPNGVNPYDAIDNQNLIWWEQDNLSSSFYLYDITKPPLQKNTNYAVQITAYDPINDIFINNEGKSEIHQFTISSPPLDPPIIISPSADETIDFMSKSIACSWNPIATSEPIKYRILMAQVVDKSNESLLFSKTDFTVYDIDNLSKTTFNASTLGMDKSKEYAIIVKAYSPNNEVDILNNGWSNIHYFKFGLILPDPSQLTNPINNDTILATVPSTIKFEWSDLNKYSGLNYNLKIWENRYNSDWETIKDTDPILDVNNLTNTHHEFPNNNWLEDEQFYFAMVKTYDTAGKQNFKNNGESAPVKFSFIKQNLIPKPIIVSPENNEIVGKFNPLLVDVDWLHEIPKNSGIKYQVSIWDYDNNNNVQDVMSQNDPIFIIEDITKSKVSNLPTNFELIDDQFYIVQVKAISSDIKLKLENNGLSDPIVFQMDRLLRSQTLDVSCGEGGVTPMPDNRISFDKLQNTNVSPENFFSIGDELLMGSFIITLKQFTYDVFGLNGTGEIKPSEFFQSPIKVNFSNLVPNSDGVVLNGAVIAEMNDQAQLPESWTNDWEQINNPSDPNTVITSLQNTAISNNHQQSTAIQLPIEFNGIYITRIYMIADNRDVHTRAKLISHTEINNDNSILFGSKTYFSSGGPATISDHYYLRLLEDFTIEEDNTYSITLQKINHDSENNGTVQYFDCDGKIDEVDAVGELSYEFSGLKRHDTRGVSRELTSLPLKGTFMASFSDWNDWIADIRFDNNSSNPDSPIKLIHPRMSDFEVRFITGKIDHSFYSNPSGLNSEIANNEMWRGIQLNSTKLVYPKFIDTDQNGSHIENVSGFSLDGYGLTGEVNYRKAITESPNLYMGEWKYRMSNVNISIMDNDVNSIEIGGDVRVPLFEDYINISIELESYRLFGQYLSAWQFDVETLEDASFDIPAWDASTVLNSDTRIYPVLTPDKEKLLLNLKFGGALNFDNNIGSIKNNHIQNLQYRNLETYNRRTFIGFEKPLIKSINSSFRVNNRTLDKIGGYDVNIQQISLMDEINQENNNVSKMTIDYQFGLDDRDVLTFDGSLEIEAIPIGNKIETFDQRVTGLKDIVFENTIVPGGSLSGRLHWTDAENYQYFHGNLSGDILGFGGAITGHCGNVDGFGFWSIGVKYESGTPMVLYPGLNATEFSGGLYCNMEKVMPVPGASASDIQFNPPSFAGEIDNFGITFGTLIFTGLDGSEFSGKFLLGVEIDTRNNALDHINLSGVAHFMDEDLDLLYWKTHSELSPTAQLKVYGDINYSWTNNSLHGEFGYDINYDNGKITGKEDGAFQFHFDPNKWFIHVGSIDVPMHVDLNILSDPIKCYAYMMVGGNFEGNIGQAFGGIEFGLRGTFRTRTRSIWFPLSMDDKVRASCRLTASVHGGIGYGITHCNHNPAEFFSYLEFSTSVRGTVEYWEDPDSYLTYFKDPKGVWNKWFSATISASGHLYFNNPTGFGGRAKFGSDGWSVNPSFNVGDVCN